MSFKDLDSLLEMEVASAEAASAPRPKLLVVDDDETVRKSLSALFGRRYEVLLCASAQEALDAWREDVCTAIVDVKMKGHDGFWTCNELRRRAPGLPVIFYSAYQDLKDPFAIINEHRPFGYITKDGERERLIHAVDMAVQMYQRVLDNQRLIQRLRARAAPPASRDVAPPDRGA